MNEIERVLRGSLASEEEVGAAVAGFLRRAEREGRIEVAYEEADSPLGRLLVAVTARGLVRLAYPGEADVLEELAEGVSPRILRLPGRTDEVRRELEEYFEGRRRRFEIPVDWALTGGFTRKVLRATARIPFGDLSTYREVASRAGSDRAYRAAGNALGSNPIPIVVPCHRVVHSGGGLGGYTGGLERKEFLLTLEGAIDAATPARPVRGRGGRTRP
jgi:methylated-DNA-[protein]-cysteine S-methyltransferase